MQYHCKIFRAFCDSAQAPSEYGQSDDWTDAAGDDTASGFLLALSKTA